MLKAFPRVEDRIVWDVGHQCYTHKILTGRFHDIGTIRTEGGISGFPKRCESPYDAFNAGHSSTSISAAYGIARAKELKGEDGYTIAVIGDGALTGGLAYEGLNNAGRYKELHRRFERQQNVYLPQRRLYGAVLDGHPNQARLPAREKQGGKDADTHACRRQPHQEDFAALQVEPA